MKPELLARTCFCGLVGSEDMSCVFCKWVNLDHDEPWTQGKGTNTQRCGLVILYLTLACDVVWGLAITEPWQGSPEGWRISFSSCQLSILGKQGLFFPTESSSEKRLFRVCRGKKENLRFYLLLPWRRVNFQRGGGGIFLWGLCCQLGTAHNEGGLQICC